MFGYLLIEKKEYENLKKENLELKNLRKENFYLENQLNTEKQAHEITKSTVQKLSEEISKQTLNCKIGPWCQDCQHKKNAIIGDIYNAQICANQHSWYEVINNNIIYCGKHTHELCPEWEGFLIK